MLAVFVGDFFQINISTTRISECGLWNQFPEKINILQGFCGQCFCKKIEYHFSFFKMCLYEKKKRKELPSFRKQRKGQRPRGK